MMRSSALSESGIRPFPKRLPYDRLWKARWTNGGFQGAVKHFSTTALAAALAAAVPPSERQLRPESVVQISHRERLILTQAANGTPLIGTSARSHLGLFGFRWTRKSLISLI